jgi:hypothetical protein
VRCTGGGATAGLRRDSGVKSVRCIGGGRLEGYSGTLGLNRSGIGGGATGGILGDSGAASVRYRGGWDIVSRFVWEETEAGINLNSSNPTLKNGEQDFRNAGQVCSETAPRAHSYSFS